MLANFSGFPFGLGKKREWKKNRKQNYCFLNRIAKSVTLTPSAGCVCEGGGLLENKLFSNSLMPTGCPTIQF